ncbi:hypothetical protein [uncultured Psychroserpens sp.]|uniref:hypothetical protein n=1 Tax=uncultured Psychroserpens sp. TaxID=255436 RepID=UPI00261F14D4|nr:hypothetical protein [uncultured Psychroserpens sp.]
MLLIHWTKHKNTSDILKNGIRPKRRTSELDEKKVIKGIWCYPFTRNKSLNNNWKSNLKVWRQDLSNFNGIVFKLEDSDFPIYAGEFAAVGSFPEKSKYSSKEEFSKVYGKYFSPKEYGFELNKETLEEGGLDYQDFEIIIPNRIDPKRIIKVIKDRKTLANKMYKS